MQIEQEIYTEAAAKAAELKQSPEQFIAEAVRRYLEMLKCEVNER